MVYSKISIITPVYNGEKFIESCIKNVIEQNCPEAEHIIIDGGSTDKTVEIIKKYARQYSHIRWRSEQDQGQSDAMNKAIQIARGEILSFLNVDDFYEHNALNRILEIFVDLPEPSFVCGNCNILNENEDVVSVNCPFELNFLKLLTGIEFIYPFPCNPSAYFYHKSLHENIGLYKIDEDYVMDLDFILRSVRIANVKYLNEVLGNFRLISGTKTFLDQKLNLADKRFADLITTYRKQLSSLQSTNLLLLIVEATLKTIIIKAKKRLYSLMKKLPNITQ